MLHQVPVQVHILSKWRILYMQSYSQFLFSPHVHTHECVFSLVTGTMTHGHLGVESMFSLHFQNAGMHERIANCVEIQYMICYYVLRLQAVWFTALFLVTAVLSCRVTKKVLTYFSQQKTPSDKNLFSTYIFGTDI